MLKIIPRTKYYNRPSRRMIRLGGLAHHALGVVQEALWEDFEKGLAKLNRYFAEWGAEVLRTQTGIFGNQLDQQALELLDNELRKPLAKPKQLPQLIGSLFVLPLDDRNTPIAYSFASKAYLLDIGENHTHVPRTFVWEQLLENLIVITPNNDSPVGYLCVPLTHLLPGYTMMFIRSYLNACGILLSYTIEE